NRARCSANPYRSVCAFCTWTTMVPDPLDTIVAQASARGPGARAIVRLSGPAAWRCAANLFTATESVSTARRRCYSGHLQLGGVHAALPADLYYWPPQRTYTAQEMVELHTLSCPPLVELLIARLLDAGARAAQPGEFTLRAFLAGKLDLTQAEAVLGIIEAASRPALPQPLPAPPPPLTPPPPALPAHP